MHFGCRKFPKKFARVWICRCIRCLDSETVVAFSEFRYSTFAKVCWESLTISINFWLNVKWLCSEIFHYTDVSSTSLVRLKRNERIHHLVTKIKKGTIFTSNMKNLPKKIEIIAVVGILMSHVSVRIAAYIFRLLPCWKCVVHTWISRILISAFASFYRFLHFVLRIGYLLNLRPCCLNASSKIIKKSYVIKLIFTYRKLYRTELSSSPAVNTCIFGHCSLLRFGRKFIDIHFFSPSRSAFSCFSVRDFMAVVN